MRVEDEHSPVDPLQMRVDSIKDIQRNCACGGLLSVKMRQNIDTEKREPVWRCDSCAKEIPLTPEEYLNL